MASPTRVHQLVVGASPGDAIYDQALLFRKALRSWGHSSEIYACHIHPSLVNQVPHYSAYRPQPDDIVIFHYSIGSDLSAFVLELKVPVLMVYHNVTPAHFLDRVSGEMASLVRQGQAELPRFREVVKLALADSEFNRLDLVEAGYRNTAVVPIVLDEAKYEVPSNEALLAEHRDGTNVLFVGRIAPNKRQEDVIKVFYYYHALQPESRLFLVGQAWDPAARYLEWLRSMVDYLGLSDAVKFTGHVPFADMVTYYRLADVFLCMSEHEGFGKPLLESMYFDVPIVAYASTAVPYTLGDAGILVHDRDHALLGELLDVITTDQALRDRLVATQRRRFETYRESTMLATLRSHLAALAE